MAVSGMPENNDNRRTNSCGCRFVRTGRPGAGWAWVRTHECDEHKESA